MKNFFKKLFCSNSMSKHFSETVQRIGKNNAGFSLVELIVVIAIMAILAAVAVIGLSAYIPKAQKAADEQMIADVKKAIELYAGAETLTPGQSGYVVIHKNKGTGEVGNVTVGGAMDQLITDSLAAMYGETKYGTELKVAYQKWTGTLDLTAGTAIKDSSYSKDPEELLGDVQNLAAALSGYYGGGTDAEKKANQTVLDIANASTSYIDSAALVAWWTNPVFAVSFPLTAPNGAPVVQKDKIPADVLAADNEYVTKIELAAVVARVNAFVTYTGCAGCKAAYETSDSEFNKVTDPNGAFTALGAVSDEMTKHIKTTDGGCTRCQACLSADTKESYWKISAQNDAKAYLSLMGQVDNMSETVQGREEFNSNGLFTSDYVVNTVSGYVSIAEAFNDANAQDGDIVIVAMVDKNGSIVYQIYPMDYN